MSCALRSLPMVLLLAGCASAAPAGAPSSAASRPAFGPLPVRLHTDTTGGFTRYVTDAVDLRATGALERPPLRLAVGGSCRGSGCAPTTFLLYLSRQAPDIQIVQAAPVVLNADGVDVLSAQARYSSRPVGLDVTDETLVMPLDASQLRVLAGASAVYGEVGRLWKFEVTPEAKEAFRRMAALTRTAP